ncbi:MAG: hypothetical protein NVS3B18_00660 [Candidatus Dormibacteria bacterium]
MAPPSLHRPHSPALPSSAPPAAASESAIAEAVEVYGRTYTTVLRSSGETRLRVLEASHKAMGSSLHPLAASADLDLGAFLYACRRLPEAVADRELVIMGQSAEVFRRNRFPPLEEWAEMRAPGRRRRWYGNGSGTLAVLIASESDVDDLIPTLVAYQIEWNKLHAKLVTGPEIRPDAASCAGVLGGEEDDWQRLGELWGEAFGQRLVAVRDRRLSLRVRLLGGTQVGYGRVTRRWWQQVTGLMRSEGLMDRPVYFISSNSHSVGNLVTGAAVSREDHLVDWVERHDDEVLHEELRRFREGRAEGYWANFLYYVARLHDQSLARDGAERLAVRREERERGLLGVSSRTALDVAAQIIALERLDPAHLDERLGAIDAEALRRSRAVLVNIDYPLGLAAYNILREVAETVSELRGVYILGKAATLNADVGDVMVSSVVHDEHSGSTYWLDNAFDVTDIAPYLRFGSGLDNQRAVTVKGTFLQNRGYLDFYYREAFTVVEMEAGPYCSAVFEITAAGRYPSDAPVNFSKLPLDFGVIHYASDTPFTQARTLGARGLSYRGMDSTYASSVAIVRRILSLEGALSEAGGGGERRLAHPEEEETGRLSEQAVTV